MDPDEDFDRVLADLRSTMSAVTDDLEEHGFRRRMLTDDPLALVLLAHLFIEREITMILEDVLPGVKPIRKRRWSYAVRVDLLEAIDVVDAELIEAYRAVGRLRNKVAHELEYEVDEARAAEFLEELDPDFRAALLAGSEDKPFPAPLRFALTMLVLQLGAHRDVMTRWG